MHEIDRRLTTYGADLSRWPEGSAEAREALLSQPEFRFAWERQRDLDRMLAEDRNRLDSEIARSGALARLGRFTSRLPGGGLAEIPWRRVAAAVIVAGMLGGALDLMLPVTAADAVEMALVDPFAGLDLQ